VAIGASLCTVASDALNSSDAVAPEQQISRAPGAQNGTHPYRQSVDNVPLKSGIWEQNVFQGTQVVARYHLGEQMCPNGYFFSPFPSLPSTENLGRVLPQKMIMSDSVWRLADGRYQVTGGIGTTRGGAVTYAHLITLHGDDRYDDELTVTTHADKHPVKHLYTGSGHWVAPCPAQQK
jgi:hypothetical protein